jgi:charged multivesicular body protein 2A
MFDFMFGKKKSSTEMFREKERTVERTMRTVERETKKLEASEKQLKTELKTCAKNGEYGAARIKAQDIVRNRNMIKNLNGMHAQFFNVKAALISAKNSHLMADSMKGLAQTMRSANRSTNMPHMARIMEDYEKH